MSRNPFRYPGPITLDSLPDLFAHHRATSGGWSMTQGAPEGGQQGQQEPGGDAGQQGQNQPPERPDDISEETWDALGDPGKQAIVRERERANAAERALAASRARPAAPRNSGGQQGGNQGGQQQSAGQQGQNGSQGAQQQGNGQQGQPDIAALIQQGIEAAMKPYVERQDARDAQTAAEKVQQAVVDAAKGRLHDATDALTNIDLTGVVNDQGQADPDKVKTALDDLVTRKPHLAKTTTRQAPPGIGGGAPASATEADKVKAALADMQKATGVRSPANAAPSGT